MKKFLFFCTGLSFLLALNAYGQHRVKLQAGGTHFMAKDMTVSPFIYSGSIPGGLIGYSFSGNKFDHHFTLGTASGVITNRNNNEWRVISGGLSYNIGYKHLGLPYIKTVGLASGMESMVYFTKFKLPKEEKNGNIAGYVSGYLGTYTTSEFIFLKKWMLELEFILPLVEYTIRSGYSTSAPSELLGIDTPSAGQVLKAGETNLSLAQPQVELGVSLLRKSSAAFTYALDYNFGIRSYSEPDRFAAVKQNIMVGVIWQW